MIFFKRISALFYNPLDYIKQIKLRYFLLFAALLTPGLAMAGDLFDIPSQDVSVKMLKALFGDLVEQNIGISKNPILEPIKALNSGALIVGGILAAYTILAGTVGTAHDGQMLGKKLSSVWVPIRYSIGTALVLPVIGGGYCVIQLLVMWVIVQGIGLAGTVWTAYVNTANDIIPINSKNSLDLGAVEEIAGFVIRAHACNAMFAISKSEKLETYKNTVGSAQSTTGDTSTGESRGSSWGVWDMKNNNGVIVGQIFGQKSDGTTFLGRLATSYVDSSAYNKIQWNYDDDCGSVNYAIPKETLNTSVATPSTYQGLLGTEISTGFAPVDVSPVLEMHNTQLRVMITSLEATAFDMIIKKDFGPADASALVAKSTGIAEKYIESLETAASHMNSTDSWQRMKDQASSQGWLMAGSWFTRILIVNNFIRTSLSSYPTYSEPKSLYWLPNWMAPGDQQKQREKLKLVQKAFGTENSYQVAKNLAEATAKENAEKGKSAGNDSTTETSSIINKGIQKVLGALTSVDMVDIQNDPRHPVIMMSELGHRIVKSVGLATVAIAVVSMIPIIGPGAIPALQMFFNLPFNGIIIFAMMAEFVIPNLPYLIWIGAICGWLLLVVESIIAAPLWAIMHLHPNGDDLTGRGADGYKLVLSLIFRPVLMVFGMIGAILISSIIGEFINKTFYSVFRNSTAGATGWSALISWIMGLFLYVGLMTTFIKQTFGIIHKLPDQLMRWMGGSTGGLGEMASGFQDSAEKHSAGAAALAGMTAKGVGLGAAKGANVVANRAVGSLQGLNSSDGVEQKTGMAGTIQKAGITASRILGGQDSIVQASKGEGGKLRSAKGAQRFEQFNQGRSANEAAGGVVPQPADQQAVDDPNKKSD